MFGRHLFLRVTFKIFLLTLSSNLEESSEVESPREEDDPSHLAEVVFRDLICRASYGNIKSVLSPVLM